MSNTLAPAPTSPLLDAALSYARRGWPVFPLKPADKVPDGRLAPNGCKDATTDEAVVRAWWAASPNANIGIATGAAAGLLVLDLDSADAATDAQAHGLPNTPRVTTGRGVHVYLAHPGGRVKNRAGILPSMDLRGDGGYVVAPPSRHPNGTRYEWAVRPGDVPLAPVPDWLAENGGPRLLPATPYAGARDAGAEALLATKLAAAATAREGQRNATLYEAAAAAGGLVAAGRVSQAVEADLLAAGTRAGLPVAEAERTVRSGQEWGATRPLVSRPRPATAAPVAYDPDTGEVVPAPDLDRAIPVGLPLPERTVRALGWLRADNAPPRLFVRAGQLVRIDADERGHYSIVTLSEDHLRGTLARSCRFVKATKDGLEDKTPPQDTVKDILALSAGEWGVPALVGIVDTPVVRPDGSILCEPGYDAATGLFLVPNSLSVDVEANPPASLVEWARETLLDAVADFPFDGPASRANAIAAILTPFIRQNVPTAPLAVVDATAPGTGKSLLASLVGVVAVGGLPEMTPMPSTDDELRKRLTSSLLAGERLICIDNVDGPLDSAVLNAFLTTPTWSDRVLGASENRRLENRATLMFTSNGAQPKADLIRRSYWVRLDAKMARPELRDPDSFRHPRLLEWAADTRAELVTAALTLIRAWYAAGKPAPATRVVKGSFEAWADTLSGVLAHAGVAGFLANDPDLRDAVDTDSEEMETLLRGVFDLTGGSPFRVRDLLGDRFAQVKQYLTDDLLAVGDADKMMRPMGFLFRRYRDARFGPDGIRVIQVKSDRNGVSFWCVVRDAPTE